MVKRRYCTVHNRVHIAGTKIYEDCFPEKAPLLLNKEALSERVEKPKKKKTLEFSSEIYISSFSKGSILKCRLKDAAPGQVVVKAAFYSSGSRTFNKESQPFHVTESEFSAVLDRGLRLFQLVK